MIRILELDLYVGIKEETRWAFNEGYSVLSALNRAGDYPSHKSMIGWEGRGCNRNHPEYLFGLRENWMALNMIDCDKPEYYSDEMIDAGLDFIGSELRKGNKVFVHCSLGESRAPSMIFLYLLRENIILHSSFAQAVDEFVKIYKGYNPKKGPLLYIKNRFFNPNE